MSRESGMAAERLAANYLLAVGMKILQTNYTCKGGELDIICDDGGTLVFVEVRSRASNKFGTPIETIGVTKRRRIVHAATHYLAAHRSMERPCRFDVVSIENGEITHVRDAFGTTY